RLAAAEATGDFWFRISHAAVLGLVALADDDPEGAVGVLRPAWELMRSRGLGDLSLFPVGHVLAEALVALGRCDEALSVAAALREAPDGAQPWCRAMARRCVALVPSARGDHEAGRAAFAAALELQAGLPEPFEHARTLLLLGRAERAARAWGAARAALVEARERFEAIGAVRWAE